MKNEHERNAGTRAEYDREMRLEHGEDVMECIRDRDDERERQMEMSGMGFSEWDEYEKECRAEDKQLPEAPDG